jgi:gliding motility-associated-like protein
MNISKIILLIFLFFNLANIHSQFLYTSAECTPGWKGVVLRGNWYIEPPELICDMVKNGELRIDPSLSNVSDYWTQFELCDTICVGNEFIFKTRIINNASIGGQSAYDFGMDIIGENKKIGLTLMGDKWAQSYTSIVSGNIIHRDRSEFVMEFNEWNIITLKITRDSVSFNANDSVFFAFAHDEPICNINKLVLAFRGSGAMDWIKINTLENIPLYEEHFEDCNNLTNANSCLELLPLFRYQQQFNCKLGSIRVIPSPGLKSKFTYQISPNPNQTGPNDTFFENLPPGAYHVAITSDCPDTTITYSFRVPKPLRDSLILINHVGCNELGQVVLTGLDGTPPYRYNKNGGSFQTHNVFDSLPAGSYTFAILDSNNCQDLVHVTVLEKVAPLQFQIDSSQLLLNCFDTTAYIHLHANGSIPPYIFILNDSIVQSHGYFIKLAKGKHHIYITDSLKCKNTDYYFSVADQRDPSFQQDSIILCFGESITVGKKIYKNTGIYLDTFKTNFGCDSVLLTKLKINEMIITELSKVLCGKDSFHLGNTVLKTEGRYSIVLESTNRCDSILNVTITRDHSNQCDSICEIQIPNVFTPNGDGVNDEFIYPEINSSLSSMKIFNRWGNLVFQSTQSGEGWDGTFNGQNANPETYIYLIEYECITGASKIKKGSITLIR